MFIDLRLPLGCVFLVFGAVLTAYGLLGPPATDTLAGHELNVGAGGAMLIFGAVMLALALRAGGIRQPPDLESE